jgi:outer membrane protein OmpA-like peptidoglycan-associated protein
MPAHAAGAVSIQIYNGQGPVLASQIFTYTDVAPTPTVTPSATSTPTLTPSTAPSPTVTPSATPIATPTVTPSATPSSSPTKEPTALKKASVYFALGSFALDSTAKAVLKRIANEFNNSSATTVQLFGYTDSQGGVDNIKLSRDRAKAVADFLKPLLTDQSIEIAWEGSKNPIASGNTQVAYAKNRRVEIWTK